MKPIRYPYWKQRQSTLELQQIAVRKKKPAELERQLILERVETRKRYVNRTVTPKKLKKQTCPCCGDTESLTVERRRTNTAYHDDTKNWETSCIHCFKEHWGMMQELWDDYYASRL